MKQCTRQAEKRPADVIGNAVHVMRIATGEIEEKLRAAAELGSKRGKARAVLAARGVKPS
jgi:hypothetical protein